MTDSVHWNNTVKNIITGNVRIDDIPEVPQRAVRVYISSTGRDSQTERNFFVENVYPKLREYCREKYGVDFQAVDLHWGVSKDAKTLDLERPNFCQQELLRCHEFSAGPSFVAFVGQRYGECPLPSVIPAHEYDQLRVALKGHKSRDTRNATLLDVWYKKDDNSIPPVYVLAEVKSNLPAIDDADKTKRSNAMNQWLEAEKELRRLLRRGAELSYFEGLIDGDTKQKYFMSEQEIEIQCGMEEADNPRNRCVLLIRTIVDLKNYVDDPQAPNFAEIFYNEKQERLEIDSVIATKLKQLKTRARGIMSENNTKEYEVLWRYDDVINPVLHDKYLSQLCTETFEVLKRLVDQTVFRVKFETEPEIYEEALQHWQRCKSKAASFYGMTEYMDKLKNYIKGAHDTPLVLYGPSGSGKSTLLSKMALNVAEICGGNAICIIRFVAYTPKSYDIKQIIMAVCVQLLHALGRNPNDIPFDFEDLQKFFHNLLESVSSRRNVVICLDAVHKLQPDHNAHSLSWLPKQLKKNVRIIITTDPEQHQILQRLHEEVIEMSSSYVNLTPLSLHEASNFLQYLLGCYGRQVTDKQRQIFVNAFQKCSIPMYVQLIADAARSFSSFAEINAASLPTTVSEAIYKLFDLLEEKHGSLIVSKSMGYLVASVTGLSDCEMEDLLSMDDAVMKEIYGDRKVTFKRVPCIRWLRIKSDIEHFLHHREADGVTVYFWSHDEFLNIIRERYLKNEEIVKSLHSMLADYFLGTWVGRAKPDGVSDKGANRLVVSQPLAFQSADGNTRFNKRKYDQVPRHLYLAGRLKELNSLVLFNYEWMYNKIKALSLTHIMADFALNPGEEATLVEEALHVAEPTIQNNINNLAPEIAGHLLPYYKSHPNIRALVQQCDTDGSKHCAFIPNFPYFQVPGSSLQYTLTSFIIGQFYTLNNDDRYLMVKERESSYIYVFDVTTGEMKRGVFASNGELFVSPNGKLFIIVDHVTEKSIKVHKADTGEYVGQLIVMNHIDLKPKEKYKMGALSITDERLAVIVTTETSYLCIADLTTCQFLQIIGLDGRCSVCEVTPGGRYVYCNSNEFILTYDMYSLEHICTLSVGYHPTALAFTKDGFRTFLANDKEAKLLVMHIHRGVVEMAYKTVLEQDMPDDKIVSLRVSPKDDLVLIQGKNNILVYNRFNEKVCAKFCRPPDVPKEFKLPKSYYTDLYFTHAEFSRDGNFVIATIFRNIYVWQISTNNLITTIQAPVGIITELLVSQQRNQIITHMQGSRDIQVWNIDEAVNHVSMLDKLTGPVDDIKLTKDISMAYIKCKDSDEIGVISMSNGVMLDLLTHDSPVHDFAITPDGSYVFVSTIVKKRNTAVKIWNMEERKIIKELGNTTGFCVSPSVNDFILFVAQEELLFKAPFYIHCFSFTANSVQEQTHPLALKYILNAPFLTGDDKFLIVLTAQDYVESEAFFDTPTICAFSMEDDMKVSYYTPESFREAVEITTILDLHPVSGHSSCIRVIYEKFTIPSDGANMITSRFGLIHLDINTGSISLLCEPFVSQDVPLNRLVYADSSFCIDPSYKIFDIISSGYVKTLPNPGVPPRLIALNGAVVVYYKGSQINAMRVKDGEIIGTCEVHSQICHIKLCWDQRTIVVGCVDGLVVSYVLIDPSFSNEESKNVIKLLKSRQLDVTDENEGRHSRAWDKMEKETCSIYSRPPSALSLGPRDQVLLKNIKPAPKIRPKSDTLMYLNARSKTCVVM
ncbi:hypothetical protein CHS0354_037858 [Potamilus streckersoni]|uniref:AAA+ ATPase domain-containing protein n=1 Tax=Potamilus streckersoni TaxID=2493646 RepID=A0AAE0W4S2_9BIVA|nr:hypothetical protein CHS0354_037858 [Potamilus streckersoni]